MYYHTCPLCGANLDPGEYCDCRDEAVHTRTTIDSRTLRRTSGHAERQHKSTLYSPSSSIRNN